MNRYSVFTHSHLAPVAVKHGFSWPALLLGPFWALWVGCWRGLAVYAVIIALQVEAFPHWANYVPSLERDPDRLAVFGCVTAMLAMWAWLSRLMNAWLMKSLLDKGFVEADVVMAMDGLHALSVSCLIRPIPSQYRLIE